MVQDIHQIIKEREVKTNLALPLSLAGTFSASVSAQAPGHDFLTDQPIISEPLGFEFLGKHLMTAAF